MKPANPSLIDDYLSRKVSIVSFFCCCLVVLLHSYSYRFLNIKPLFTFDYCFETILSQGIAPVAVPTFFFISGYLFFHNYTPESFDWKWFKGKLTVRFFTLLQPFVLWVIIGFALNTAWLLFLSYRNGTNLVFFLQSPNPLQSIIKSYVFGAKPEPLIHLWYLRRLFLFVLLTPIFYCIIKKIKVMPFLATVAVLVAICHSRPWLSYIDCNLFYFLTGCCLALHRMRLYRSNHILPGILSTVLWGILIAVIFLTHSNVIKIPYWSEISFYLVWLRNSLGIVSLFLLYDSFSNSFKFPSCLRVSGNSEAVGDLFRRIVPLSFFIYCCHIPVHGMISHILYLTMPAEFLRYLGTISLTLLYAVLAGLFLRRFLPRFYYLLSGKRG